MSRWYRVFGTSEAPPDPAALLEHLRRRGVEAEGHFRGDDQGWFRAELVLAPGAPPLELERFLSSEEGIRAELNTWAAWLEAADSPHSARLMRHMIGTRQLFTLRQAADEGAVALCRFLAGATDGVYQVDGAGFF